MIHAKVHDGTLLVIGCVRGLASEVPGVLAKLDEFAPRAVGIGVSFDEAKGLREYFVLKTTEPLIALAPTEAAEVRALTRYGEVRVPNPSYVAVLVWGVERGVPVEAVDPSDDAYADMFAEHIGYLELVRRTLKERRLTKRPPEPPTADEFAVAWSATITSTKGSARLANAREESVVGAVQAMVRRHERVALVVDRERFDGFLGAFGRTPAAR